MERILNNLREPLRNVRVTFYGEYISDDRVLSTFCQQQLKIKNRFLLCHHSESF